MRKIVSSIIVLTFLIAFVGCATLPLESNIDKPVNMTKVKDEKAGVFVSNNRALWLFWGAIPLSVPTVDGVLSAQVPGHAGVQNLKITTESGFIDLVVTFLTQGILTMRPVTIQGEVYD